MACEGIASCIQSWSDRICQRSLRCAIKDGRGSYEGDTHSNSTSVNSKHRPLYPTQFAYTVSAMEGTSSDMGESTDVSTPIDYHPTSKFVASPSRAAKKILYHAHTLVLFTCDNLKDVVIPPAVFGVLATLSGPALDLPSQNGLAVLQRVPATLTWFWLMLLPCCLQNQRHKSSLQEDAINKPGVQSQQEGSTQRRLQS